MKVQQQHINREMARRRALKSTLAVLKDAGYRKQTDGSWSNGSGAPLSDVEMNVTCISTDAYARRKGISPYDAVKETVFEIPEILGHLIFVDGGIHIVGSCRLPLIYDPELEIPLPLIGYGIQDLEIQGIQEKIAYIRTVDGDEYEIPVTVHGKVSVDPAWGIRWLVMDSGDVVQIDPRYS